MTARLGLPFVIILALVLFVWGLRFTDELAQAVVDELVQTAEDLVVESHDGPGTQVALTTNGVVTDGNYQTLASSAGSPYSVPAERTAHLLTWSGLPQVSEDTSVSLEIGYADTQAANSATAPTGAVAVYTVSWQSGNGPPDVVDAFAFIPSGKYPYVRPSGGDAALHLTARER